MNKPSASSMRLVELCLLPLWPLTIVPAILAAAGTAWRFYRQPSPSPRAQLQEQLRPALRILVAPIAALSISFRCGSPKLAISTLLLLALTLGAAVGYGISFRDTQRARTGGTPASSVRLQAPSKAHPFGTTSTGRDLATEIALGCKNTQLVLSIAVVVVLIAGVSLGSLRLSRRWGSPLSRLFALIDTIPVVFGLLIICGIASLWFGRLELSGNTRAWLGPITIGLAIGIWLAVPMAHMVGDRIEVFRRKQFIDAALTNGISPEWIIWHHIIRKNLTSDILLMATHLAALAVLYEVSIGFIFGLGSTKLGSHFYFSLAHLIGNQDAQNAVISHQNWWLVSFPMLFIVCSVLGLLLHGDGLRNLQASSTSIDGAHRAL